ncbi:hypothetical protein TKK_0017227 [Trichogramma kaykai]
MLLRKARPAYNSAASAILRLQENFVAGVLQFQLYRALCQAAGQRSFDDPKKPLHKCDFYRNPEAGRILG